MRSFITILTLVLSSNSWASVCYNYADTTGQETIEKVSICYEGEEPTYLLVTDRTSGRPERFDVYLFKNTMVLGNPIHDMQAGPYFVERDLGVDSFIVYQDDNTGTGGFLDKAESN